jgi:small subunit ribosomal protein S20
MANHKSAIKRIRSNRAKFLRNRFQVRTTKSMIKRLKGIETKTEALEYFRKVSAAVDKLAKKNIIHKNKAANTKSRLAKMLNAIAA